MQKIITSWNFASIHTWNDLSIFNLQLTVHKFKSKRYISLVHNDEKQSTRDTTKLRLERKGTSTWWNG